MNQRLASTLADVFRLKPSDIHPGLTKRDIGSWDSLRQMDLVISLENEFQVTLGISDIMRMTSVAGIMMVLSEKGICLEG